MADWNKLKKEYVKGGVSYRQLCEKYNVPFGTLSKVASKENWAALRKKAGEETDTKLVDAVSEQNAKYGKEIYAVADLLLEKLKQAVECTGLLSAQSMRQYTAALRDLKDIKNIRSEADMNEQRARIDKLRKEIDKEDKTGNDGVNVVMSSEMEEYAQ